LVCNIGQLLTYLYLLIDRIWENSGQVNGWFFQGCSCFTVDTDGERSFHLIELTNYFEVTYSFIAATPVRAAILKFLLEST
jgi:hypothetical protein